MKKSILLLVALSLLVAGSAFAGSFESAAIKAAKDAGCISANDASYVDVNVETTSLCFVSGAITTAQVWYNPVAHCNDNPSRPCPKPAVTIKAEVVFGCNNEIVSVTCY